MKFRSVSVGQKFQFEGSARVWTKVTEVWDDEAYAPVNCRDEKGGGACADDNDDVEVIE